MIPSSRIQLVAVCVQDCTNDLKRGVTVIVMHAAERHTAFWFSRRLESLGGIVCRVHMGSRRTKWMVCVVSLDVYSLAGVKMATG